MFPNLNGSFDEFSSESSSVIDDFLTSIRNQNANSTSKQSKALKSKSNFQYQKENENFINFSNSSQQDDQFTNENKLDIDVHYDGMFSNEIEKKKKRNKQSTFSDEDDDDFNLKNPKDIPQSKNSKKIHFMLRKQKPIIITSEELRQASLYNTKHPLPNQTIKKSKRKKSPKTHSKADPTHSLYNSKKTEKSQNKPSPTETKSIKKPKKEINEMVERLSKPAPRPKVEKQTSTKRLTSNEIFDRLYDMSTEKQKKIEEIRQNELQKEIEEEMINQKAIKSTQKSIELAEKKVLRFVDHCFKHLGQSIENELFSSLYIESTQTKDQSPNTNQIKSKSTINQSRDMIQFQNETHSTKNETKSNVKNQLKSNMENESKQPIVIDSNDTGMTNGNVQINNITNETGINEIESIENSTNQNQTKLTPIEIVPNNKNSNENEINNTNNNELDNNETFAISKNYVIKREISQSELFEILFKLGLITSRNETMDPTLQYKMNEWILNEDKSTYDCKSIYKDIIYSVKGNSYNLSQFNKFCKKRILISLSNLKNFQNEQSAVYKSNQNNFTTNQSSINQNEPINCNSINLNKQNEQDSNVSGSVNKNKKSLNPATPSDSILRLSQCRRPKEENPSKLEDPFPIRKRDVFKMNPYSEELEKPKQSKQTKLIYQQEIAKISFHDRESILLEKRKQRMKKIEEENYNVKVQTFHRDPNFTQETQQQLKEYKEKKEKMPRKVENTFKPAIIDYEEFKKAILKEMIDKKERPEGYYSDISRHRMAYQKYLDEKKEKEKEEDLDYIYSKY